MYLFVRQSENMQFDRDSEESYQEKRTKLGGVVLAKNLPIEIHASEIYMTAMFEKFGEMLYEGGSYVLIEVVPRREYIARHVKKDSRDKWCKNEFLVQVNELADEFKCECGMFEHFGMLKVMIGLGRKTFQPNTCSNVGQGMQGIYSHQSFCATRRTRVLSNTPRGDITICICFALKLLD